MADVCVTGWVAEGGSTIVEGQKNNIVIFDLVENINPTSGIEDDVYGTNKAWFHCSLEVFIEDKTELSFVPSGYRIDRAQSNGYCWLKKKNATEYDFASKQVNLSGEQVAEFLQEGQSVYVRGQELLVKGEDGKILRVINVSEIYFEPFWQTEKPKMLKVPYKSRAIITTRNFEKKEDKK